MKLKIEDKDYTLNTQRAVELGVLTEVKSPVFYKIGQRFSVSPYHDTIYILIATNLNEVLLANLTCGNRWSDAIKVNDYYRISEEEFKQITKEGSSTYCQWTFTRIP